MREWESVTVRNTFNSLVDYRYNESENYNEVKKNERGEERKNFERGGYKEKRKPRSEIRATRVTVQVTDREKEMLAINARKKGQTVSDYIRSVCIYIPYNELTGGDYND